MQIHPRMTSRGRMWAALVGIALALALPKRVERGTGARCTTYEVVPFGFYVLETVVGRIGVSYASGQDCR